MPSEIRLWWNCEWIQGASDFLLKPFEPGELLRRVARAGMREALARTRRGMLPRTEISLNGRSAPSA